MKTSIIVFAFFGLAIIGNATSINLGPAADYGVLGVNGAAINTGATVHLSSGPLIVNGNVGSGDNGQFQADGGGHINGRLDFAPSATVNPGNDTFSGGLHQISFTSIEQAVQNEANFVQSLTPTQSLTSITNATTLNSTGGQNVISIAQNIHLSDGNLTLNGSASDVFIFQIKGTMELSGNSNIVLTGGLTPNNVLFDFIGAGSQFQTSGQSKTAGIFLAEDRAINITGGVHDSEFISGVSLSFQSNPTVNQPQNGVPDGGSTFLLMSVGLVVIGIVRQSFVQHGSN
jgi:Ice-binding-like